MIQLTSEQMQFVEAQVAAGGYKDSAAVVQAGIEMLRKAVELDYEETVEEIKNAIPDMEAGPGRSIEVVDASIREKLGFAKPS